MADQARNRRRSTSDVIRRRLSVGVDRIRRTSVIKRLSLDGDSAQAIVNRLRESKLENIGHVNLVITGTFILVPYLFGR